jgi:D-inositol-3-phosphate glycosyltransferase
MRPRVCFISDHASPLAMLGGVDAGGQNVYVGQVARGLARIGYQVDVFTRRERPGDPEVVPFGRGVRVIHVDAGPAEPVPKEELLPYMGDFSAAVTRAARRVRYDLAHAHFFLSGLVADELKRRAGVPYAVTFHALGRVRRREQGAGDGFPDDRFGIEDRVVEGADAIVAECPQDREDLLELYAADARKLVTIPCGVDSRELSPGSRAEARARLGLDPDVPLVLQLGRLVPRKGVDDVIRAMAVLSERHPADARLLIVGGAHREPDPASDPELRRLMTIAADLGVADRVTFAGSRGRDELVDHYRAADVFVSAPWYEPFGITPLEAMACAIPVVGSAVGGIRWTVVHGETGLLVPPRDPGAIADALARVLADPLLAERMGAEGLRRVHRSFTWQRVSREMAGLYETVLGRARRTSRGPAHVEPVRPPRPAVPAPFPPVLVPVPIRAVAALRSRSARLAR